MRSAEPQPEDTRPHHKGPAIRAAAIFLLLLSVSPAFAGKPTIPGPVAATVLSVVDGDTIKVEVEPWPGIVSRVSVRLRGADAPELRGKCREEKAIARRAKKRVQELVEDAPVILRDIGQDKYAGRVDAVVEIGGQDLATMLIAEGLARPYGGGKRGGWCD